ncbi:outer membrane protein assembly factor BamB family protein [Tsukamurella spumae]|uniref:PQQ-binding-like beta-propeller repeat protein n=1 Tax=Tsukamurella spumae TaxID=44753 RepID=A0A846X8Q7_9ACTN|nr:PQQ-binding-like beta-propeller repeat protein [Tsukamurella spumae]NKY20582.1 PQQ-binding-like beta-propeller repeat protein [Tsukamurella spumae]
MTSPGGQPFPYGPRPTPQYGYGQVPPPPAPARRSALAWILAGVSVVCVVILVAGGIWWFTSRKADDASAPVPGQLTKEFPTAPSVAWTVRPSDVGGSKFFSTNVTNAQYNSAGAATDGRFVLTGVDRNRLSSVVAIDADGRTSFPQKNLACADQVVGGRTVCRVAQSDDPTMYMLDLASGQTSSGISVSDNNFGLVAYNGDAAFRTSSSTITRFSDRRIEWSRPVSMDESPGGDFHQALATRDLVIFYYGGASYVASAHDGKLLHSALDRPTIAPDGSVITRASHDRGTVVIRPDGSVRTAPSGVIGVPALAARGYESVLFIGGQYFDAAGNAAWKAGDATVNNTSATPVPMVSPRITVVGTDTGFAGFDTTTGEMRWTNDSVPTGVGSWNQSSTLSDGRYLIFPSARDIVALDTTTGKTAWRIPSPLGSDERIGALLAVGDAFVIVGTDRIVGYKATGGAAGAPGAKSGTAGKNSSDDSYYTRCGSKPVFTPQKFRTESGGLVVTMKITATCPGGDALISSGTSVTISDSTGLIATGTFDFAANPVGVPKPGNGSEEKKSGTTVDLLFKQGQFFRTPDTLPPPGGGNGSSGTGGLGGHSYLVDCVQPDGSGKAKVPAPSDSPIAASGPGPQTGLNPMSGLSALRIQADSDKAFILGSLNNRWVAQLSSKRVGLVADGRTWDEKAILDEFLALRLRFADVRLLYSDEWPVFNYQGWWVSVAAATFPGPDEANQWCRSNGFDRDHCFAKLVSSTASPEGSTRYW